MSNIKNAFSKGKAFIAFVTAGHPTLDLSYEYITKIAKAGADIIEIGIPFSDPVAEGVVIQKANTCALKKGVALNNVFELTKRVRKNTNVPIVYLTYYNPVFNYGVEKFFEVLRELGVDGIIIPDLPFEESEEVLPFAKKNNIDLISLIAPTSSDRICKIAKNASGYIYLVSSMGVTGMRHEITTKLEDIVSEIRKITNVPVCVGFGINTKQQAAEIAKISDGVIVGSAIVSIIENNGTGDTDKITDYVEMMKNAITES
ncbi:MAG: tryptophan synthase subunit alpha [Christensenellaceae bacterium]|jgi:tryptophan synthase alpha chain|nr:tryptophan synthase subunit alpha [Christensenellaceae bacterium]